MIKRFGHAHIHVLLDAIKNDANVPLMKTVNTVLYLAYKHGSTIKWLAAYDLLGAVANPTVESDTVGPSATQ